MKTLIAQPVQLRLASYNIQKCVGLDLRRQPRRILTVLDGVKASIVVLQEADKRLPPRPAALPHFVLNEAGWQIADLGGAGSLGWHGNAVIWRDDRLRVLDTGHMTLPGLEPRGAVRVEFETPLGPLRVIGLHLGLIGQYRRKQVQHLAQETLDLDEMPTVWAGDFNEWSRQPVLDRCAPRMRFLPPHASFPAPRPMGPLDRIAVGFGLAVQNHGVYTDRPAHIASDHLPIWADLATA
ncbi:endonuclease/exonuclease/phosphatase family protein [Sedimentitalea nanhaiensis]|uniref:Metal-dependent hydrolase, endonuclease/exonuclease/phosphatase family n=1 Tax=Sedimentitalea nanhaiensis TaxID=999627 RepID=A0A1I7AN20_9RHOB|nr:endonuclease/exonuclease/phosphatase family protein [Sedimentitalea nanhaiensis]SFT76317.1 Metal-dependent hydrolase, endonuclease/exonuclease/phosphatase family [Sedimentitalea nanhaiensis]